MRAGYTLNRDSKSTQFSKLKKIGYDVVGNIAILKFDYSMGLVAKKKFAVSYLKKNKSVTTVLEKIGKFSGRLRTLKTRWLAGFKTKEALYRENGCEFRFNVDTCYFSPRLSEERKKIAGFVKKGERVLVMFGGVGPFAVVIGKRLKIFGSSKLSARLSNIKHSAADNKLKNKFGEIVTVELGREASKYALMNVKRNKLDEIVSVVQGDVRLVIGAGKKVSGVFDRIVMARPNLEDSFLDVAFRVARRETIIYYYGFYLAQDVESLRNLILSEALKAGKKVKILRIVKAGDIGTRKWRFRVDIKII